MTERNNRIPWYVWAPLATVVAASMVTVWLAFTHAPVVIVDRYQSSGDNSNARFAADLAAERMGLRGELALDGGECLLRLSQAVPANVLAVHFRHATRAEADARIELRKSEIDVFRAPCAVDYAGRSLVTIEPPDQAWRLLGSWTGAARIEVRPRAFSTAE